MNTQGESVSQRKLVFVSGKGGVGKTAVSQGLALHRAKKGDKTLWITFEDPFLSKGVIEHPKNAPDTLFHLNCVSEVAFEEYVSIKIGSRALTKLFLQNPVIRYFSKAAPGIHELVLLGKVWHETKHFDAVIVDLPSTGHGLAMFQSTKNFSSLFTGGPIQRDSLLMMETLGDPSYTGHLIVALPEEMPLQEALDLGGLLKEMFPKNPVSYLANRLMPAFTPATPPAPESQGAYVCNRILLEQANLELWRSRGISFDSIPYFTPPVEISSDISWLVRAISEVSI